MEEWFENKESTKAYLKTADEWLEARFFPRLREITGQATADTETMYDVVDYIDWAMRNGRALKIDLTDEDKSFINIADEVGNYEDIAVQPDITYMETW